jgi:hypothetical protein
LHSEELGHVVLAEGVVDQEDGAVALVGLVERRALPVTDPIKLDRTRIQPTGGSVRAMITRRSLLLVALVSWPPSVMACDGAGDSMADAAADDATLAIDAGTGIDARPPTGCVVVVATTGAACAADCEAHLFLPGGMSFCTLTCEGDGACTPYGANLTCAAEVGTCMPRCSDDAGCQAAGFPRCHPVGSFCDTLPPCSTDAQCRNVGLSRCVMPGVWKPPAMRTLPATPCAWTCASVLRTRAPSRCLAS